MLQKEGLSYQPSENTSGMDFGLKGIDTLRAELLNIEVIVKQIMQTLRITNQVKMVIVEREDAVIKHNHCSPYG